MAAGVSPSDLKLRRGALESVFPLPPNAVLGFEAAGVVDALGPSVSGVEEGTRSPPFYSASGATASMSLPRAGPPSRPGSHGATRRRCPRRPRRPWEP
ncbi:MAG: alcohol dehydrogenase catalytic domain-containing protein [Acidimicrobiales bacterium]